MSWTSSIGLVRNGHLSSRRGRLARVAVATAMAVATATLAGCRTENADTDCSADACTITFQRGAEASADVLGVTVELVDVRGDEVVLDVSGREVTLPVDGSREVAGLTFQARSVTEDEVMVQVSR
ncbi:MAG: hypothetical protein FWJ87_10585 [Micromonosporaceae bacterium]